MTISYEDIYALYDAVKDLPQPEYTVEDLLAVLAVERELEAAGLFDYVNRPGKPELE